MKLTTVAEALSAEEDTPVLAIRGTLVNLYDVSTGDGDYGPWTLQGAKLKDKTGEIKVAFSNRDPVPKNWRNKVVELRCAKGAKGGWSGVKVAIDKRDKNNKLQVSDKAEVILFNEEHQPEADNAPAKASSSPQEPPLAKALKEEQVQRQSAPEAARNEPVTGMEKGMAILYRIANCQYAAATVVHDYLLPLLKQRGIEVDIVAESKLVQNMLIQAYYTTDFMASFPMKKLGGNKPQASSNGEPPPASGG